MPRKLFAKGQSGNPGGRPKILGDVRELAKASSRAMIQALVDIATDKDQPAAARVSASEAVLNRAWGRPPQTVTGEGGAGPVKVLVEWVGVQCKPLRAG